MVRGWDEPVGPLETDATHLWCCDIDATIDESTRASYLGLLDEREIERMERFVFARDQHRFLVSHALLRSVLALYTGQAAKRLRFQTGPHGKPELVGTLLQSCCRFNLSHSGSMALMAVTRADISIGVDIEVHEAGRRLMALGERNFAPLESASLRGLHGELLVSKFYQFWTLKEAYIKGRGVGLSQSLREFWFSRDAAGSLLFDAQPVIEPAPQKWHFWSYRLTGPYSAALALQAGEHALPEDPLWFHAVPLQDWMPLQPSCVARSGRITGN